MHTVTSLDRRLAELQLGHLPQQVRAYITRDLAGASADEINRRVNREYIVAATQQAIAAQRKAAIQPGAR